MNTSNNVVITVPYLKVTDKFYEIFILGCRRLRFLRHV
jgi:hypothetical protein